MARAMLRQRRRFTAVPLPYARKRSELAPSGKAASATHHDEGFSVTLETAK